MSEPFWAYKACTSIEDLKSLQLRLLQKQLNRVYESSRFYRSKFENAGIEPSKIKSLQDIPKYP